LIPGHRLQVTTMRSQDTVGRTNKKALANLDSRERIVIIKRFGLDEKEPLTLNQVAELLNVSSERVRQIEADAIKKLRSPQSIQFFEGYN
ncbi:MAG: hypothetical protein IKX48_06000, partial [Victivallales bacterium]|nr:hypothetical protein [Victivallales bacterium]